MGKLLAGIIIGGLGLYAYQRAQRPEFHEVMQEQVQEAAPVPSPAPVRDSAPETQVENDKPRFRCDGRTHCSQMTSCDEAEFFLENCPDVKMDGEGDGVPCEKQWCGHH